ncbi:MAG: restriction endonuclease subunit S [Proteiniphilum sp.]|nr:restriction endonuclease subunit S [Proteiniphilum sp.]
MKTEIPEGYKNSPVGIIPEEWEVKRLGELFTFKNGINSGKENYGSGIKFVNTLDVLNNIFITYETIKGSVEVSKIQEEEFAVRFGDILFNRTSETREDVGHSVVYLDDKKAVFGGFIIRAQEKKKDLHFNFKKYCFKVGYVRSQITALGNGAIRYNIGQNDFSKVIIVVPPLLEQQKIAEIISEWDVAIEKQTLLIEKLELRKRALMQQLLTGKKRLKGFDGEWKSVKLGDIANIYQPQTIGQNEMTPDGYDVYGANGIIGKYSRYNHEKSQIAVVCRGSTCGIINFTKPYSWITGNAMVINVDDNKNVNKFYLNDYLVVDDLSYLISGSGQPQITGSIRNHKILLPSLSEQTAIAEILLTADQGIHIAKEKLEQLKKQKKGLMQVLLTGKKRVITTTNTQTNENIRNQKPIRAV